jgi:hypothetical protein
VSISCEKQGNVPVSPPGNPKLNDTRFLLVPKKSILLFQIPIKGKLTETNLVSSMAAGDAPVLARAGAPDDEMRGRENGFWFAPISANSFEQLFHSFRPDEMRILID